MKFEGSENNLLPEPVIVASSILPAPTFNENPKYVLHPSAPDEFRIDGTGFIGAKKVDLYFDPPLVKEVNYENITPYPLTENFVILRLRRGYKWRENAGPLKVIGVDTGAGAIKVNGEEGVVVAQVTDLNVARSSTNIQLVDGEVPKSTPVSGASVPAGVSSDFLNEFVEMKKIVNQVHEKLQEVLEICGQKFPDKELVNQACERQLQVKEQLLQEKEAAFRVQTQQLQERIQALELQLQQQQQQQQQPPPPQIPVREQEQQLQERLRTLAKQLQD